MASFPDRRSWSRRAAVRIANDGEFRLAARYWTGRLSFDLDGASLALDLLDGRVSSPEVRRGEGAAAGVIHLEAPAAIWDLILAPVPPPFFNDIFPARALGLVIEAEPETLWQYYPAVQRAVQILREERNT